MSKSIKLKSPYYWDSDGVIHEQKKLSDILYVTEEHILLSEGTYDDDITLNDDLSKYRRIVIFYKQTAYFDTTYGSITVENPNGKNVNISETFYIDEYNGSTYYGAYLISRAYKLNSNKITKINDGSYKFFGTHNTGTWGIADSLRITKVIGYK